jgi:hypothetical protein
MAAQDALDLGIAGYDSSESLAVFQIRPVHALDAGQEGWVVHHQQARSRRRRGERAIIWIAEAFREEHRAAIDWLNASTIQGFDFFAVEVEALRIGASSPAPRFNIVSKPNDWSRDVVRVTRSTSNGPMDDRARAYAAYWSGFSVFI